jgi:hypothetical protein
MMRKAAIAVFALVLAVAMVGTTVAQQPGITAQRAPGAPAASAHPEAVLWDQPVGTSGVGGYSVEYVGQNYGVYTADDFENTDTWDIDLIYVTGFLSYGLLEDSLTLNWCIYPDAGGEPGGYPYNGGEEWCLSALPTDPWVTISGGDVTLTLPAGGVSLQLEPGHWWLVFWPKFQTILTDYWSWWFTDATTLNNAEFIDPTDYFGQGWTSWTPWLTPSPLGYDMAFRLEGGVVPPAMHVASLALTKAGVGPWRLTAKGQIHDGAHLALPGVLVTGQWTLPGGQKVNRQFTTNAQGGYQFQYSTPNTGTYRFCIVQLAKAGYVYVKADNHMYPNPPCRQIMLP